MASAGSSKMQRVAGKKTHTHAAAFHLRSLQRRPVHMPEGS